MNPFKLRTLLILSFSMFTIVAATQAQLRRPNYVTVKKNERKSKLVTEPGAVYLEGVVSSSLVLKTTSSVPVYSSLSGKRWLGTIASAKKVDLLAISDKAYRVRGQAQHGQIAGWIRKDAITGLPEGFEEKLVKLKQRLDLVGELIENSQVALGMTPQEVIASIGPPDSTFTETKETGSKSVYGYISYTRTPQDFVEYNRFGFAVSGVRYIEVETGRLTIEFSDNLVSSITETEGINVNKHLVDPIPPLVDFR